MRGQPRIDLREALVRGAGLDGEGLASLLGQRPGAGLGKGDESAGVALPARGFGHRELADV